MSNSLKNKWNIKNKEIEERKETKEKITISYWIVFYDES